MPSPLHWRDHSSAGSATLLELIPRGRRASTTARTMSGAKKASGMVFSTWRIVKPSRAAMSWSTGGIHALCRRVRGGAGRNQTDCPVRIHFEPIS